MAMDVAAQAFDRALRARYLDAARHHATNPELDAALTEGRAMTLEQAIALALDTRSAT